MRQLTAAAALLALNVSGAGAQESQTAKDYAVGPAAYVQCSTLNDTAPDTESDNLYYAWARGYLTALNSGRLLMHGTMRHLNQSAEWQKAWIRSYCRQHPDHSYGIAVFIMWNTFTDGPSLLPQIQGQIEALKKNPRSLSPKQIRWDFYSTRDQLLHRRAAAIDVAISAAASGGDDETPFCCYRHLSCRIVCESGHGFPGAAR